MTKTNTATAVKTTAVAKPLAIKLIDGTAAINAAIDSITKRGKALDRDIQIAAVSCMAHHAKHGDVTLINRLIDGMPKGSRVNALREFIQATGGVSYDEKAKAFKHEAGKLFNMEAACEKPWTAFKPEPEYIPFDAKAAIAALVKRMESGIAHGDAVTKDDEAAIRTLAASVGVSK